MSKAERTRQYIIEKTAPLFNRKGYSATSLHDMVETTGLTKGSIYGNFRDKEEVALEAYGYNSRRLVQQVAEALAHADSAYGRLVAFIGFYRASWQTIAESGGCPLMNAAVESDDLLPFMQPHVGRSFLLWKRKFAEILEEGIANGEFKNDISPEKYAVTFVAMLEGGILLSKVAGDSSDLFTVLDRMKDVVDREIRK